MKRLRFLSGFGNGKATIPGGQLLYIKMVPGLSEVAGRGSWMQVAECAAIWVPQGTVQELRAADLGNDEQHDCAELACHTGCCDQYPGDVQIEIVFGQGVQNPKKVTNDDQPDTGEVPQAWLVVYAGNP